MANFKFSFANQYNSERLFDIDTDGLQYHELSDIYSEGSNETYVVEGLYINTKGLYDPRPCVVASLADDKGNLLFRGYVNLPAHMTETCREILRDKNAVAAINAGKVGFTIYAYEQKKYNRTCFSIRWADI